MAENPAKKQKTKFHVPSHEFDIEEANDALTEFVVGAALPFSVVEHVLFIKFISIICKPYVEKLPSRRTVSGRLLKKAFDKSKEEIKTKLDGSEVCFLADSWKNSSGKHTNFAIAIHNVGSDAVFVDSFDMTAERETSENLAESVIFFPLFYELNY